jgi:hypothetical protein
MKYPPEYCWSFTSSVGESRYSFSFLAPTKEIAESIVSNAICEGAISPVSNAFASRQSDEPQRPI